MNKFKYIFFVLFFFSFAEVHTQVRVKTDSTKKYSDPLAELKTDIESLITNPDLLGATIGVSVYSLDKNKYIFNHNADHNFIPASTQKILTSLAALHYLGKDFRFNTNFYLDGLLEPSGMFKGNIIIRGNGDPSLNKYFYKDPYEYIDNFIKELDSIGINSIRGNIIGFDRYFDNTYYPQGWAWDDMVYPYSAQVNALAFNGNKIDLIIEQGDSIGHPAKLSMYPDNTYIRTLNYVRTVPKDVLTEITFDRGINTNLLEIFGSIAYDSLNPSKEILSVSIDNPTIFILNVLQQRLKVYNIQFKGALIDVDDINESIDIYRLEPVYEHNSPPLIDIINVAHKFSDNLTSEMILKTIGKENTGEGSFLAGIEYIKKYLSLIGIPPEKVSYVDGSGLSRQNFISPKYQVSILNKVYRSDDIKDQFIESLAVPGENGTLERRMKNSRAEKNVFAKTGSMNNVSTLCGYVRTRDGEMLAFSIMLMNFTAPLNTANNLQDLICMRLASFSRKSSN